MGNKTHLIHYILEYFIVKMHNSALFDLPRLMLTRDWLKNEEKGASANQTSADDSLDPALVVPQFQSKSNYLRLAVKSRACVWHYPDEDYHHLNLLTSYYP